MSAWRTHHAAALKADVPRPTAWTSTEQDDHQALAQWLDMHRIVWTHSPMGGYRREVEAAIMHGMGARAGVPDILVFTPPPRGDYSGLAIEMKRWGRQREPGGGVTDDQAEWLDWLESCGWYAAVCYGLDEALRVLEVLGYGR